MLEPLIKRIPPFLLASPLAVVMGGPSPEREFSFRSGKRVEMALSQLGFSVTALEYDPQLQQNLERNNISLCFLATHGVPGEDGKLQGYLESLGYHYTGARVAGCALAINKLAAKSVLAHSGITTPPYAEIDRSLPLEEIVLKLSQHPRFPLVVKPVFGGSSIGIRLVHTASELRTTLEKLLPEHHHLFAEQYIPGREFSVSVLEDSRAKAYCLPVLEVSPKNLFYDYESKIQPGKIDFLVPAPLEDSQRQQLCHLALNAHRSLFLRDFSRSDFIMNTQGEIHYLETNAIPGLTETSDLPAQAKAAGITFEEVIFSILHGAFRRSTNER